jgi:enterochelin esterase-like enzyme
VLVTVGVAAATATIGGCVYPNALLLHRRSDPPMPRVPVGAGRLSTVHFNSRALGRRADYLVYLPDEYVPSRPLPVFYMLHGMPGRPLAFTINAHVEVRLEKLIRQHRVPPMILVFPDGRIGGRTSTDSEWADTSSGRFDSYVVDVVHDVDVRFATLARRQDRVIAGLSAGAYGAINVGLHHVDLFGLVQVWSGYFMQTRTGVFARATSAQLADNSPIEFVKTMSHALAKYPLRAFLFVGRGDSDSAQLAPMAAALKAEGVDAHYAVYSGGHDWNVWSAHLDQMLILAGRDVQRPLPRGR